MTPLSRRLLWYKNRLAAMSAAEIVWRLREAARKRADRFLGGRFACAPRDYGDLPRLPGLRENLQTLPLPDSELTTARLRADQARGGTYDLLGRAWPPCPPETVWHIDPTTCTFWPRDRFCFDIDYRHGGNADIKYTWELNRLQFLQPIAALAFQTGDEALARFCLERIESWIDANPPFRGVNWNSGIELALRSVSILVTTTLTGEHLTRAQRGKVWSSLRTHARWVERYPSRYSSANNHRTAEGLCLFMIGALCPHFSEAHRWRDKGWRILQDSAQSLILPDGGGAEQSPAYAAFALEMIMLGVKIAQSQNILVPAPMRRKLAALGEFLRWLTDANGNQPLIGDNDDSCVIGCPRDGDGYAASILGCVASLTGRADIAPPVATTGLRHALFGPSPAPDFAPGGWRLFPHAGLSIGRHARANGDILLAFDHGPVGYLSIAAHGHADALSLWLHIGGQPVFVDAGTYAYHGDETLRAHDRGTRAHNCLNVAGADSSQSGGDFNWSRKADAWVSFAENRGAYWHVEAAHDGYQPSYGATVRRAVHMSPDSGFVIHDWLDAENALDVEIAFLLHPDLTARVDGSEILILKDEHPLIRLRHESALTASIDRIDNAYAPRFGTRMAATRIAFSGVMEPGSKAKTQCFWAV